jgi:hypothetical protein
MIEIKKRERNRKNKRVHPSLPLPAGPTRSPCAPSPQPARPRGPVPSPRAAQPSASPPSSSASTQQRVAHLLDQVAPPAQASSAHAHSPTRSAQPRGSPTQPRAPAASAPSHCPAPPCLYRTLAQHVAHVPARVGRPTARALSPPLRAASCARRAPRLAQSRYLQSRTPTSREPPTAADRPVHLPLEPGPLCPTSPLLYAVPPRLSSSFPIRSSRRTGTCARSSTVPSSPLARAFARRLVPGMARGPCGGQPGSCLCVAAAREQPRKPSFGEQDRCRLARPSVISSAPCAPTGRHPPCARDPVRRRCAARPGCHPSRASSLLSPARLSGPRSLRPCGMP